MSIAHLAAKRVIKAMCVGFPGSGKTGSLAALANAGYSLRIVDLDGNFDPLLEYVRPENYKNVHIVSCRDPMKLIKDGLAPRGKPMAYENALRLYDKFTYESDGTEVDLGPVSSWGPNDVLVYDNLTALGRAAMRRTLVMQNRADKGPRKRDWGLAMGAQNGFCEILGSEATPCNVIMISHLKLIGPEEVEDDDDQDVKEQKREVQEIVPYRYWPSALGRQLPPTIAEHFPFLLHYETVKAGRDMKRVISAKPTQLVDTKLPLSGIPDQLPIEDGLLQIFKAVRGTTTEEQANEYDS